MISWGNYKENLTCRQKCLPCGAAPTFWSINWAAALLHLVNGVATFGLWAASEDRDNAYNLTETAAIWSSNVGTTNCSNGTLPDGATFSFQVSEEFCISRVNNATSQLSLWWLVIAFHCLSFVFQALSMFQWNIPCCGGRRCVRGSYVEEVDNTGTNVLRMVEYSVSATLMQIAIALVMGIWHRLVIVGIAFLTVVTMLLGLIAE